MKQILVRFVRWFTWRMLRVAGMPRYLGTFECTNWIQGASGLRERYGTPLTMDHPRFLNQFEAKAFSQHGEDGILLEIFERIGTTNKRFVEIGVENGRECNTANLAINFGWEGIQIEGNAKHVEAGRHFFAAMIPDRPRAVVSVPLWVSRDNVDPTLQEHGMAGPIDLLSIDIDGNDYWVWESIQTIDPRVVVIEYNPSFGATRSVTVPYEKDFVRRKKHESGFYHGVSLSALAQLGRRLEYSLIGCDTWGGNAFFVKSRECEGRFTEFSPDQVFMPALDRILRGFGTEDQWEVIKNLPLATIK